MHVRLTSLCIILVLVAGCATSPIANTRLEHFDADYGYRARNLQPTDLNSDSLLVILTFSGGGTRAAALAYGVLEQLRDTPIVWEGTERTLLDEVDIISSVSGGSLTAAYYTLFGDRIFEEFPDKVLYTNIQKSLIRRTLLPPDNIKVYSPLFTRTDILAQNFDHGIFEGKTYADLTAAARKPFLVINATDMSLGTRFEFTQDQFDHLYSDLGAYRVGYAVAASACFPGAFPPITLHNFDRGDDYCLPPWAENALREGNTDSAAYRQAMMMQRYGEPGRSYVHLIDGGVADNLGLLPVIQTLRRNAEGFGMPGGGTYSKAKTILIITANAETRPPRPWDMMQSPVGLLGTLFTAGTAPLSNFSTAQIEYLKLFIQHHALEARQPDAAPDRHFPDIHFVEVAFSAIPDPAQRDECLAMPTSFKLGRGQVDLVRHAAAEVLGVNADYQDFLAGTR